MRVWHDDVRPAPEGWVWATNNRDAKLLLSTGEVTEISLDHDLGASPSDGIFTAGHSPEGNGYDLVVWMIENDFIPEKITIHSWNPGGAMRMAQAFNSAGVAVNRVPFQVR